MVPKSTLLLALLCARALEAQTDAGSIAISHVAVIDVVAGKTNPDMTVIIRNNRIEEIGPADSVKVSESRVVDGRGKFLMPGMWDMHVHLGNATEAMLPIFVAYGVTGLRDMGSPSFEMVRQWRVEALAGKRIAPRNGFARTDVDDADSVFLANAGEESGRGAACGGLSGGNRRGFHQDYGNV